MTRVRILLLLSASLALLAQCVPSEQGSDELTAMVPGAPAAIDPMPRLVVGVASGDTLQEFYQIRTPFLLPNGELVVSSAGSNSIRIFAPDGTFRREIGGSGEGPGEFTSLTSAWSRGDTIEAGDDRLQRITRFVPDGSVQVISMVGGPAFARRAAPGPVSDGWLMTGVESAAMGGRDQIGLHRFARDGAYIGEVARVEGMARETWAGGSGPPPLSPRAIVRVARGEIYVADTHSPRLQVLGSDWTVSREVSWAPDPQPDLPQTLAEVIDSASARAGPSGALVRQRLTTVPPPVQLSVFWDFLVDELGFIWIRPYEPVMHAAALGGLAGGSYLWGASGQGGTWSVLDPDGGPVGSIEVPAGLRPSHVTETAIVGVRIDPLGVESVHVHSLERH